MRYIFFILVCLLLVGCSTEVRLPSAFILPAHYTDTKYDEKIVLDHGISMSPTLFPGNTMLVRTYKGEALSEGQIVCYEDATMFVCHRIITCYETWGVAQGDNSWEDTKFNFTSVKYVVVGVLYT